MQTSRTPLLGHTTPSMNDFGTTGDRVQTGDRVHPPTDWRITIDPDTRLKCCLKDYRAVIGWSAATAVVGGITYLTSHSWPQTAIMSAFCVVASGCAPAFYGVMDWLEAKGCIKIDAGYGGSGFGVGLAGV